jgi:signal transduction histidine kinase
MVARSITERWHHEIGADQLAERGAAAVQIGETPAMQRFFVNMLRETGKLDSTIVATTESVRSQIGGAERTGLILSFVLGMLAILAAAGVGALVYRMRKLAEETERRRMETAAALAESARAAEARTRLLRGITHDVKNPLGAAKGYADLLELGIKGSLSEEQHKLVKGMARSIDNALAIISDLLDLARSDSGGITVQRVRTDLNQLACEAVEDHRAAGQSAGHVLECRNTEGELIAFTDPLRVRQVLDNLISNAIKYTPAPGRIVVRPDPASRGGAPAVMSPSSSATPDPASRPRSAR